MSVYSLSHLRDGELLRNLKTLVGRERATTAEVLAHIAEVDARKLYLPAAHPSMHSYCVHELGLSEQSAYKRIRAARAALRFPRIFSAVAEGRLSISGIVILSSHLTPESADQLLSEAEGRSDKAIEQLLAQRFPSPDLPEMIQPLDQPVSDQLSARTVEGGSATADPTTQGPAVPGQTEIATPRPRVFPLAAERFALQTTIERSTHEKLCYAQALLGHRIPRRDIAQVLDRALDALIARLEKQKFGATSRPRPSKARSSDNPRCIPLEIRRQVWERDGGRCTFVSETGRRCPECSRLEFDHVLEVARGGGVSAAQIRLRCRAHNQYGAECAFGREFMESKRTEARARAAARRAEEIIPALRGLGFRADESRRAAAFAATSSNGSLEDRVKLALSYLCPKRGQPAYGRPLARVMGGASTLESGRPSTSSA